MATTREIPGRDKIRRADRRPRSEAARDRYGADIHARISANAANLIGMIQEGLIVHARLRELSTGDVMELAISPMFLPGAGRSCDIIDALRELRDHGLVRRSETVSRGDSSEYLLTYNAREIERVGGERPWKAS